MPKIVDGKLVPNLDPNYLMSDDWGDYFDKDDITAEEIDIETLERGARINLFKEQDNERLSKMTTKEKEQEYKETAKWASEYAESIGMKTSSVSSKKADKGNGNSL